MALNDTQQAEFLTLVSGHVSDAMEILGIKRSVLTNFICLGSNHARMVGTAFTIRQRAKSSVTPKDEPLVRHAEVSGGLAGKGEVVVVDIGGRTDVVSWGEFHTYKCLLNGVTGVLINGATRDAPQIRDSGMTVMVKGLSPIKSRWDLETAEINGPVTIDGVGIRPGDVIFGDETGVVVVPQERIDDVLAKAKEIRDFEDGERDAAMAKLHG
ncbi:RraA family protein [Pelagibacterium lacus]|uniref:Putative 4-hydroxy-4-methyl-2-oxoglutarate aldolase n=1 Tax=Pelagibacterium lacus TaxID=2282655 RepID=A0A369W744_9HYPH|nr:hypothetical protein [Pelagibacterium lacus]RDE07891.1 hypothetical protein DVH29_14410 [Pelagibacterium lacus]